MIYFSNMNDFCINESKKKACETCKINVFQQSPLANS